MFISAPNATLALVILAAITTTPLTATAGNNEGLDLSAKTGLGYDSNAYMSPASSYTDPGAGLVNPDVQSGLYVPYALDAKYTRLLAVDSVLITSYSLDGNLYLQNSLSNANEYKHKINVGRKQDFGDDSLYLGAFISKNKETYFDRDDGTASNTKADRYSYNGTGLRAKYKNRSGNIKYAISSGITQRDYEETPNTSYDYDGMSLGGELEFKVSDPSRLTIAYDYSSINYDKREGRDLSGNYVAGSTLDYVYNTIAFRLKHKINSQLNIYLDYSWKKRDDEFLGYADYTKNKVKLRANYKYSDDLKLAFSIAHWNKDYPNAFAFNDSAEADKEHKGLEFKAKTEYTLADDRTFYASLERRDQNSTDPRYEYDRHQLVAGMRWDI
ncbi:MAG: hypothetical protein KAJ19_02995 [Gammaproteobacteria bacterium]|nr:hypothetical protein [Gammaproteobacteria bacterium]